MLQDLGVLLHPRVHRVHHQTYTRNFCIFNGCANPVVDAAFHVARTLRFADSKVTLGAGGTAIKGE
jgi:sterol desaturase/sphingolipid hydroxylase (fatty acid hydroxylase superfamily)